jgi:hypothetical protein
MRENGLSVTKTIVIMIVLDLGHLVWHLKQLQRHTNHLQPKIIITDMETKVHKIVMRFILSSDML